MTSEIRTTIEPKDIVAIEMECTDCKTRTTTRMDDWRNGPTGCPNCGAMWINVSNVLKEITKVAQMMQFIATKEGLPFSVRFELSGAVRNDLR